MGKRDARQFLCAADINKQHWNIVELESRRQFGEQFAMQLVRSLHRDDQHERQSIVWLLTLLDNQTTIPLLEQMSRDVRQSRSIRLSAALALAGMGATAEMMDDTWHKRLYATG